MKRILTLAMVVFLAVSSLVLVGSVSAQSAPKPSIPEFTVQLVGPTYTKATTYALNSSTGQVQATLGYTNPYTNILLKIKNQPYDSAYGTFYYDVRYKYHNAQGWQYFYYDGPNPHIQSNTSDYTDFTIGIDNRQLNASQIDVQVQALLGGYSYGRDMSSPLALGGYRFGGEKSEWSGTQTISVPANVPLTPTPDPQSSASTSTSTASPVVTSNSTMGATQDLPLVAVVVGLGAVVVLLVVVVGFMRRRIRVLEHKMGP
jgi:hypothetical protein